MEVKDLAYRFNICSVPGVEICVDPEVKEDLETMEEIREMPCLYEVRATLNPIRVCSKMPVGPITKISNLLLYTPEHPKLAAQICKWLGAALTQSDCITAPWCLSNVLFDEALITPVSVCKAFMVINMLRHYQHAWPLDLSELGPKFSLVAPCFDLHAPNAVLQSSSQSTWTFSTSPAAAYESNSLLFPDEKTLDSCVLPLIGASVASTLKFSSLEDCISAFEEGYFKMGNPPFGFVFPLVHWKVLTRMICLQICLLNRFNVAQTARFIQDHQKSLLIDFPEFALVFRALVLN
jgi:hypothetical protein